MKNQINLEINEACTKKFNQRKKNSLPLGIVLACLFFFSFSMSQAQTKSTNQESNSTITKEQEKNINVQGNVSDQTGKLAGVNVVLQGTSIGTKTDTNGDFEFPKILKKGDVLVFSFVGLKSQKIVIDNNNSATKVKLKIDMELPVVELLGSTSAKKVYKSTRSSQKK